jgi:TPR repeat protein
MNFRHKNIADLLLSAGQLQLYIDTIEDKNDYLVLSIKNHFAKEHKLCIENINLALGTGIHVANLMLGWFYQEGRHELKQDYKLAIEYYDRAIQNQVWQGFIFKGITYSRGLGVNKDHKIALDLYREALNKDCKFANYFIGLNYLYGFGVAVNKNMALEYFEKAKDNGFLIASYEIGKMYKTGDGVEQNEEKALEYFQLSIKGGVYDTYYYLAKMLQSSNIPKSIVYWLRYKQKNSNKILSLDYLGTVPDYVFDIAKKTILLEDEYEKLEFENLELRYAPPS